MLYSYIIANLCNMLKKQREKCYTSTNKQEMIPYEKIKK